MHTHADTHALLLNMNALKKKQLNDKLVLFNGNQEKEEEKRRFVSRTYNIVTGEEGGRACWVLRVGGMGVEGGGSVANPHILSGDFLRRHPLLPPYQQYDDGQ